jgi:peptide/nickel transport system substrate-binding protein
MDLRDDLVGRLQRRRFFSAAGAAAAAFAAARGAAAQTEVVADELKIVAHRLPSGLDPVHEATGSYLRGVGAAEGLVRLNPAGEVEPELAHSYELVDPLTWRMSLRPGTAFWSGRPVDAAAVTASLERSRQLVPSAAGLLQVQIEPVDEWTVQFRSDVPAPDLPFILADPWLVIHNADSYGPQDNAFDLSVADLTGFFKVTEFDARVRVMLERNDRYWGVPPRMRQVRFEEVVDPDARLLAALSGEAHIVRLLSASTAGQVERSRTMRLAPIPGTSCRAAQLNIARPPLDDVRVRQALAWAVDRDEFVQVLFEGKGAPAPSWLASLPAYPEARRVGYTRQDLAKAAQLLDEAGWRLPPGGTVRTRNGTPLRVRILWWGAYRSNAEVLQAHWARVGVGVEIDGANDAGYMTSKRRAGDWDIFLDGAWPVMGDPAAPMGRHLAPGGGDNYAGFRDPATEQLLAEFAQLFDPEERRQQALKVNARQAEVVPFIPLAYEDRPTAVSRNIRNYTVHYLSWGPYEVHPDLWVST